MVLILPCSHVSLIRFGLLRMAPPGFKGRRGAERPAVVVAAATTARPGQRAAAAGAEGGACLEADRTRDKHQNLWHHVARICLFSCLHAPLSGTVALCSLHSQPSQPLTMDVSVCCLEVMIVQVNDHTLLASLVCFLLKLSFCSQQVAPPAIPHC